MGIYTDNPEGSKIPIRSLSTTQGIYDYRTTNLNCVPIGEYLYIRASNVEHLMSMPSMQAEIINFKGATYLQTLLTEVAAMKSAALALKDDWVQCPPTGVHTTVQPPPILACEDSDDDGGVLGALGGFFKGVGEGISDVVGFGKDIVVDTAEWAWNETKEIGSECANFFDGGAAKLAERVGHLALAQNATLERIRDLQSAGVTIQVICTGELPDVGGTEEFGKGGDSHRFRSKRCC